VTLPEIGKVKAAGLTPTEFEDKIGEILRQAGKLKEPSVSVLLQEPHYNTWSMVGEPGIPGLGTYAILSKNFRMLDAVALAHGMSTQIKKLYVIRQVALTAGGEGAAAAPGAAAAAAGTPAEAAPKPEDLLKDLLPGVEPGVAPAASAPTTQALPRAPAPAGLESALEPSEQPSPWAYVNGKWVKAGEPEKAGAGAAQTQPQAQPLVAQRIIEIPVDKLLDGDPKYNIVIRPGDIIHVPAFDIGNVYVGGQINRPGTYGLPAEGLTLKQLVFSAGNFASLAVPERTDVIRRVGNNQEVTVRVNLKAIFNGTQPDIFLKPNDTINIGTNFINYFAQVIRNGFRTSYGFGFTIDRDFDTNVFGPVPTAP
jgi:polysaccharide export outer membrane protein